MLLKVAKKSAKAFMKYSELFHDEETYEYAFFIIYSFISLLLYAACLGVIFKVFIESVLFFLFFFAIRAFAGGYHADTEIRCEIISFSFIFFSIITLWYTKTHDYKIIILILSVLSIIVILILSPLDTTEKPLTKDEFDHAKKVSFALILIISIIIILSLLFKINCLFYSACISMILESIMMVMGKAKNV